MNRVYKIIGMMLMFIAISCSAAFAADEIAVEMNHKMVSFEQKPIMNNGRVLVPLRKICEKLGADVIWEEPNKIILKRYPHSVTLEIGSTIAMDNDKTVTLDAPPVLVGDYTYVPIRFIGEGLGVAVSYDEQENKVTLNYDVKRGNSNGNIIMKGDTAKDGDFIYTSAYYGDGLWKINAKTYEKEKILPFCASYINIVDGWIYANLFTNEDGKYQNKGLYKCKIDGRGLTKLSDLYFISISVVNNKIYGTTFQDSIMYSMNLDGGELHKLSDYGFEGMNVTDQNIYMRNDKINRMDLDTEEFKVVAESRFLTGRFIVDGDWIYFLQANDEMFKTLADGSGEIVPLFKDVYSFNISNGYIYYVKLMESGVYKATTDGKDIEKISDASVNHFDIFDDYLYCSEYCDSKVLILKNDGSFEKTISLNESISDESDSYEMPQYFDYTGGKLPKDIVIPIVHIKKAKINSTMPEFTFMVCGQNVKRYGLTADKEKFFIAQDDNKINKIKVIYDDFFYEQELVFDETNTPNISGDEYGFSLDDWNFDGYLDISLWSYEGGTMGNSPHYYWLWDKDKNEFVECEELEELSGTTSVHNDLEKKQVIARGKFPGGNDFNYYEWQNGKLILIKTEEVTFELLDEKTNKYREHHIIQEPVDGEMKVTQDYYVDEENMD